MLIRQISNVSSINWSRRYKKLVEDDNNNNKNNININITALYDD